MRNTFISGCLTLLTALAGHHSYSQNVVRGADLQEQVKAGVKIVKDSTASSTTGKGSLIPVPVIVTEPALGGIGAGVSLGYLNPNKKSLNKDTPPTVSGILGGFSKNKSWAVGIGHSHSFNNDKIRYTGVVGKADVNMTFYEQISSKPFNFDVNLNIWLTYHKLLFRMNDSKWFVGVNYLYFHTKNSLDLETNHPRLDSLVNSIKEKSKLGMLGVNVMYDGRDNTLSPNTGLYLSLKAGYNSPIFGGQKYTILGLEIEENFLLSQADIVYYFQVSDRIFGGIRFNSQLVDGNYIPFYVKPYINLRGVPSMRYQGKRVMVAETQWRGVVYKKLSLLGFVGTGKAMDKLSEFGSSEWIYNYGGGFRVGLRKVFDLRLGIDVAWSNDDFAWYISVGKSF